jgi:hypothetical protein
MSIINKQSVTIDNDTYDLLGIDDKSQKYYIRRVDAADRIRRTDFIFIMKDNHLVDAISYRTFFDNLDKIIHSTLSLKELSDLKDSLDHISNLKRAYKLAMHSSHGIFANTSEPSEDVIRQHEIDLMQYYPQIITLFERG